MTNLCLSHSLKGWGAWWWWWCLPPRGTSQEAQRWWGCPCSVACNVCEPGNHRALLTTAGVPGTSRRAMSPLFYLLFFCLPLPPTHRTYRPVIDSIWSASPWPCILSLFQRLVFFLLIFVSWVNQPWNWIGSAAAQSRGRTICLVLFLFWGIPWGKCFLPTG